MGCLNHELGLDLRDREGSDRYLKSMHVFVNFCSLVVLVSHHGQVFAGHVQIFLFRDTCNYKVFLWLYLHLADGLALSEYS